MYKHVDKEQLMSAKKTIQELYIINKHRLKDSVDGASTLTYAQDIVACERVLSTIDFELEIAEGEPYV
jgi:hypothetical protein